MCETNTTSIHTLPLDITEIHSPLSKLTVIRMDTAIFLNVECNLGWLKVIISENSFKFNFDLNKFSTSS